MNFINESTKQTPLDVDFRSAGLYLFHNVLLLCNWANDTFSNSKDVFNQDTFASSQTLSRKYLFVCFLIYHNRLYLRN